MAKHETNILKMEKDMKSTAKILRDKLAKIKRQESIINEKEEKISERLNQINIMARAKKDELKITRKKQLQFVEMSYQVKKEREDLREDLNTLNELKRNLVLKVREVRAFEKDLYEYEDLLNKKAQLIEKKDISLVQDLLNNFSKIPRYSSDSVST